MVLNGYSFKKKYSNIGIDFGSSQIKIIQFKKEKGKVALHRYVVLPLPDKFIRDGKVRFDNNISRKIKEELKKQRFKGKNANICISNHRLMTRSLKLPKMINKDITEAIRWETANHFGISANNSVTDYMYFQEVSAEGKEFIRAHIVAAPRDMVKEYIDVTEKAALFPEAVEIEALSLNRLLRFTGNGEEENKNEITIILDIGSEFSNINIYEDKEFAYFRNIGTGLKHIISEVAGRKNITESEAFKELIKEKTISEHEYKDIAEPIVETLRQTIESYIYRIRDKEGEVFCRELILCGGGALIKELPFLFQDLPIKEISYLNLFDSCKMADNGKISREVKMIFNVAAGLALRGWAFDEKRD